MGNALPSTCNRMRLLMRVFRRFAALTAVALLATGFMFHNRLVKSLPEKDSAVSAPTEIRLWFRETAAPALSSITLVRATDSAKVALGKVTATDEKVSIKASVNERLAPGVYLVQWKTSGDDGHIIRGSYPFTVIK